MIIPQTIIEVVAGAQMEISVDADAGIVDSIFLNLRNVWEDKQIGRPRIWELSMQFRSIQPTQQMLS